MSNGRIYEIVGAMNAASFEEGRKQERKRIITKLDAIKGEVSWDFETQIHQLIEELRRETE